MDTGSINVVPVTSFPVANLPETLKHFIEKNGIPEDAYNLPTIFRFIRFAITTMLADLVRLNEFKPTPISELCTQIQKNLSDPLWEIESVPWLPNFFKLPGHIQIYDLPAYKNGNIYGMDASSGAVVVALDPQPNEHILDLCCAPGAKLCMISDKMKRTGSITGVDICEKRLATCRTMCAKYGITNARLFLDDASKFSILAPTEEAIEKLLKLKKQKNNT